MIRKLLVTVALATTALTFLPSDAADARRGIRGGGFRAAAIRGPAFRPAVRSRVIVHRRVVVRRPLRIVRVGPVVAVGGGCEWLRRRAVITGSPYWWRRYRRCRGW